MSVILKSLDEFREVNRDSPLSGPVRQWKESGKKVIGFTCTYAPEEIIHAAGALPVYLISDCSEGEMNDATGHLSQSSCSYARTLLQMAMDNRLDFLDGIVFTATCDGMRRLADVWEKYVPIPIVHTLMVPRKNTEWGIKLYSEHVNILKEKVEKLVGSSTKIGALEESVALFNKGRELVGDLYQLRKQAKPPVTGAEVMEVLNASSWMPRGEFNLMLERLLAELKASGRNLDSSARLMVVGSIFNNPHFMRGIEDLGALVVTDGLCGGIGRWSDMVELRSGMSTTESICRSYLNKFPCPRLEPDALRLDRFVALASEYHVDGVISQLIRYCVTVAFSQPLVREKFAEAGIPVLELDKEYGTASTGQVTTRVQAFLEMLEGKSRKMMAGCGG